MAHVLSHENEGWNRKLESDGLVHSLGDTNAARLIVCFFTLQAGEYSIPPPNTTPEERCVQHARMFQAGGNPTSQR